MGALYNCKEVKEMSKKNKKGKKNLTEKILLAIAIIDLITHIVELLKELFN